MRSTEAVNGGREGVHDSSSPVNGHHRKDFSYDDLETEQTGNRKKRLKLEAGYCFMLKHELMRIIPPHLLTYVVHKGTKIMRSCYFLGVINPFDNLAVFTRSKDISLD